MKMIARGARGRCSRFAAALPEEGRMCLAAAAGCLPIGAAGWMLGSAAPALSQFSALMVVGLLYVLLAIPDLMRTVSFRTAASGGGARQTLAALEAADTPAARPSPAQLGPAQAARSVA